MCVHSILLTSRYHCFDVVFCGHFQVTVAMGKYDVTMKIADEGGGASRSEMDHLWTYNYTTANKFLVGGKGSPQKVGIQDRTASRNSVASRVTATVLVSFCGG